MLSSALSMARREKCELENPVPGFSVEWLERSSNIANDSLEFRATWIWRRPLGIRPILGQAVAILFVWAAMRVPFQPPGSMAGIARAVVGGMGFFMMYFGLAVRLNTTAISADRFKLTVRHGPMPWPGNRTFKLTDVVSARAACVGSEEPWFVVDLIADLKSFRLIGGLPTQRNAEWITSSLNAAISRLQSTEANDLANT